MILAAIYFTFAAGLWIISPSAADWWLTPVSILTRILKS
jgi:hypothetical protein